MERRYIGYPIYLLDELSLLSLHMNVPGKITRLADVIFLHVHMCVINKKIINNMATENVETLVENQNFMESLSKKKNLCKRSRN